MKYRFNSKTPMLLIFILVVVPLVNIALLNWVKAPVFDFVHDPFIAWAIGFLFLIIELLLITLPGFVPILGEIYLSFLGRFFGFPDKQLDQKVDEFLDHR